MARVTNKEFEIPKEFREHISTFGKDTAEVIEEQCEKVEKVVARLGISHTFSAVITDGDLAVSWKDYWREDRRAAKSVSDFPVTRKAGFDGVYRARPSSCPGRSCLPEESICIHLWTTWSPFSGLRSGAYSSTRTVTRMEAERW